jgi:pimeloyl-ACP methyl ester carboxylesterase
MNLLLLVHLISVICITAARDKAEADPDVGLNVPEIISRRGYSAETHYVTTEDGYILTMFRVSKPSTVAKSSSPVILQHGLLDSAFTWVSNYEDQSLAYLLVDAGIKEVWLGNNRGNHYGRNHTNYDPDRPAPNPFWAFSFDEMAKYDAPAMIKYVKSQTGAGKVNWVGHSEGTMQMFAAGAYPSSLGGPTVDATDINLFVALAPVGSIANIESKELLALAHSNATEEMIGRGMQEFLPIHGTENNFESTVCMNTPHACAGLMDQLCGPSHSLNISRFQVYFDQTPAGTSMQNMLHFLQGVIAPSDAKYTMMDYGRDENMARYGQAEAPIYDLRTFSIPTAIFSGSNDWMADPIDVQKLYDGIDPQYIVHSDVQADYAHLDFVWATNAAERIYTQVQALLLEG